MIADKMISDKMSKVESRITVLSGGRGFLPQFSSACSTEKTDSHHLQVALCLPRLCDTTVTPFRLSKPLSEASQRTMMCTHSFLECSFPLLASNALYLRFKGGLFSSIFINKMILFKPHQFLTALSKNDFCTLDFGSFRITGILLPFRHVPEIGTSPTGQDEYSGCFAPAGHSRRSAS